jgi:SAM-dependent MidA family methyltransferase
VLTIDYGHTAQDYFAPERSQGTVLSYYRHRVEPNPYLRIGEQDITAHVNFSTLALAGEQSGLPVTGFTDLMNFLLSLGADELVGRLDPESKEFQSAVQLLNPRGMGRTFKVLIQHKGIESPTLQGLRFKPFFEGVLETSGSKVYS